MPETITASSTLQVTRSANGMRRFASPDSIGCMACFSFACSRTVPPGAFGTKAQIAGLWKLHEKAQIISLYTRIKGNTKRYQRSGVILLGRMPNFGACLRTASAMYEG